MTTQITTFLKTLLTLPGLSGHEKPVRDAIAPVWRPLIDEMSVSRLGSLHGLKRGHMPEPRPALMISTHMDAIGMMITGVVGDFLHFTRVGGLDPRVLPGQLITVHGRKDLPGVIVMPPARFLPPAVGDGAVPIQHLLIDTGLPASELADLVRVGDLASYAQPILETSGETLVGHSLDNRASVAALTHTLHLLQERKHAWDVWAVASVQEEETLGGAATSAFHIRPSLAVVVDVTFGASPGSPAHRTFPLGKGITIGWGPNIHPALFNAMKTLAEKHEIPFAMEVMPRHSGTDAYAIQVIAQGIPCVVLSIPLRYMHTPVEMVAIKDIQRAGRLMAEFISSLEPDFMQRLVWED